MVAQKFQIAHAFGVGVEHVLPVVFLSPSAPPATIDRASGPRHHRRDTIAAAGSGNAPRDTPRDRSGTVSAILS
jgi:hypothetical protein